MTLYGELHASSPAFTVLKPLTGLLYFGELIALAMTIYLQPNTETLQNPGNAVEAGGQIGQVEYLSKPVSPEFGFFYSKIKVKWYTTFNLVLSEHFVYVFNARNDRPKFSSRSKIKCNIGM